MLGSSNRVVHMMVANHSLCPPNFCCSDPSSGLVVSGLGKGGVTMLCNICTPRSDTSFNNEEIALAVPLPCSIVIVAHYHWLHVVRDVLCAKTALISSGMGFLYEPKSLAWSHSDQPD